MKRKIGVLGASGFVGTAVAHALEVRGYAVVRMRAPRLSGIDHGEARAFLESQSTERTELARAMREVEAVVNAAGNPDASSVDSQVLNLANGVLPGLVALAARDSNVPRFVHVSSAVVQGRAPTLDESQTYDSFSPYASSKILGERYAHHYSRGRVVVYRPPSVHALDRRVTRMIARVAASPLGTVARPGTAPSPQALLANVADAVAYLATTPDQPPPVVIHPWEGLTTEDVMLILGGRTPRRVPRSIARATVWALTGLGRGVPGLAANARRIELLWFGQAQASSWLTEVGWTPPAGRDAWTALGHSVRGSTNTTHTEEHD